MVRLQKNFSYGEPWEDQSFRERELEERHGRVEESLAKFTTNDAFVDFAEQHGYRFYIDYDFDRVARTNVTAREIIVNGNYPDALLSSFIQHEMGHLMLFDVNQFVTVGKATMRSTIADVIYTPENLSTYGMRQLLLLENIIQDIIIETVSDGFCVCSNSLTHLGGNMGVKHLPSLEDTKTIARETAKTVLREEDNSDFNSEEFQSLGSLLESMLKDLEADMEEIGKEIEKNSTTNKFSAEKSFQRLRKLHAKRKQLEKVQKKLAKKWHPKLQGLADRLAEEIEELESPERIERDAKEAEAERAKEGKRLSDKLEAAEELHKALEEQLRRAEEAAESSAAGENQQADGKASKELMKNYTDRNSSDGESPEDPGHSFDCGFPQPVTVDRSESHQNERHLRRVSGGVKIKTLRLSEDDAENSLGGRRKAQTSEYTYFKSAKREFDETDMLKGKRRERLTGINVLIGLDVSGSMTNEWTTMFTEISQLVEKLKETLDIEEIVYFTYNHRLQEHSRDIADLRLTARGGNAFGYVYQDVMTKLPMMQKNEIILVTDCGDNLGFKLDSVCQADRNGIEVENHISIIDTEGAGFYAKNNFQAEDWDIYSAKDRKLYKGIKNRIEELIER